VEGGGQRSDPCYPSDTLPGLVVRDPGGIAQRRERDAGQGGVIRASSAATLKPRPGWLAGEACIYLVGPVLRLRDGIVRIWGSAMAGTGSPAIPGRSTC
jgi:hypothetical protein